MEILFSNVEPTQPEEVALSEPVEEALLEEVPLEEVPLEEVPLEEVPLEEVPLEDVPLEEVPLEEAPLEEAPVHARSLGPRPSVLKVSARSRPSSVAGAIAGVVRELGRAEVQAIGAGATNQAVKAVAIARSYLQDDGIDIVCIPGFVEVIIEQEERTAIRLVVEKRG